MSQGKIPLTLQANRGTGTVVLCAFDPASPPLADWTGSPACLSACWLPPSSLATTPPHSPNGEAGRDLPVAPDHLPASVVAHLGAGFDAEGPFISPATAVGELAGYLRLTPNAATPPLAGLLGVVLLGYVVLVGPVCFVVLSRRRRRQLTWVAVPCLAAAVALAAGLTWTTTKHPVLAEIRVGEMAPGEHLAQVTSLGVLQLPGGGSRQVELTSPTPVALPLVGGLPDGDNGEPRCERPSGRPHEPGGRWPPRSSTGWVASEERRLAGSVQARGLFFGGRPAGDGHRPPRFRPHRCGSGNRVRVKPTNGSAPWRRSIAHFSLVVEPYDLPSPQAFGAPVQLDRATRSRPGTGTWCGCSTTWPPPSLLSAEGCRSLWRWPAKACSLPT